MMLADVPTDLDLARWQHEYRVRYAKDHAPPPYLRGLAPVEEVREDTYDATTMAGAIDTLARLEAEVPSDPPMIHTAIAIARGQGFAARRDGKAAADNPYWKAPELGLMSESERDLFMSWHAGYVQADPNVVIPRSPGYTPPPPRRCADCDEIVGYFHKAGSVCMQGRKRRYRVRTGDASPIVRKPIHVFHRSFS